MNEVSAFELYGKHKNLYVFNTGRGSIVFKALSYDKTQTAKRICDAYPALAPIVEEDIWDECVVECTIPEPINKMKAGLVSTIVRLILRLSNPKDLPEIKRDLQEARDNTMSIREEIVLKICQAFPAYKPEDVEAMEWRTQLKRLVQAEKILGTTFEFQVNKPGAKAAPKPTKEKGTFLAEPDGPLVIDWQKENQILNSV